MCGVLVLLYVDDKQMTSGEKKGRQDTQHRPLRLLYITCRVYRNGSRISGMRKRMNVLYRSDVSEICARKITRSGGCARTTNYSKASSALRRTRRRTFFLYASISHVRLEGRREIKYRCVPAKSVRISFAASTFAGLSKFGFSEDKREITLSNCG